MGHNLNSDSESTLSESNNMITDTDIVVEIKKDEKPYKCTYLGCNLSFHKPSRLKRHIRFHTGEVMVISYAYTYMFLNLI